LRLKGLPTGFQVKRDEKGIIRVKQTKPRTGFKARQRGKEHDEVELPPDMPSPPDEVYSDPGMGRGGDQYLRGPRRPTELHETEWAVKKWNWKGMWMTHPPGIGKLHLWFSKPQVNLWERQVKCPYCGVGVGVSCVGRSFRLGEEDEQGFPKINQTQVFYTHQRRVRLVWDHTVSVPWEILPDWIWWATKAIGQDEAALHIAMSNVRSEEFTARYMDSYWLPELARQRRSKLVDA
jgi:hypothetical protein